MSELRLRNAEQFGGRVPGGIAVDFRELMERVRRIRARLNERHSAATLTEMGIDVHFGEARFAGRDSVMVGERALRFKKAREGMRALKHVTEQVVFMGTAWKWVWMYEVGGRKLGYLHPMEAGVSGTFVLSELEEREFAVGDGMPKTLRQAIRGGAVSAGVRWCWMEFPDLEAVEAFVEIVRLKHQFLARPE